MGRRFPFSRREILLLGLVAPVAGCRFASSPVSNLITRSQSPVNRQTTPAPDPIEATPGRKPQNILVLSGGGSFGAFTAGVLNGWSRTGARPEFDVVTGVSTGALISPLAFLGPKGDAAIRRQYTEVRTRDVFTTRAWATVPFRDAAASTAPLRRIVESTLGPEVIDEIAVEHRKGRRLYVGTTNLDARQFTVWDIGAIATRGGADARRLIIDVLIASSSVPGVFPPVPIPMEVDGKRVNELHADGGVTSPLFLPSSVLAAASNRGAITPPGNVYVIVAGRYYANPSTVQPRVLKVLGAAAGTIFHGHLRSEVANLYHASTAAGVKFHVAAVRQDFPLADSAIEFDPDEMTKLYTEGVRVGAAGPKWDSAPAERNPGDGVPIRTGIKVR